MIINRQGGDICILVHLFPLPPSHLLIYPMFLLPPSHLFLSSPHFSFTPFSPLPPSHHLFLVQQPQIILMKEGTDSSQGKPQLISNINACSAVVDAVRTTLGPRGMDKLIVDGKVTIAIQLCMGFYYYCLLLSFFLSFLCFFSVVFSSCHFFLSSLWMAR